MKNLNKCWFLHAKSRSSDNAFPATSFLCFFVAAVCDVKTESNNRCSKTRFVLVWFTLFFITPGLHFFKFQWPELHIGCYSGQ